eukprot:6131682-Heterocapsa_arctica.AAC.1
MDKTGDCASKCHRRTRMPDDDRHKDTEWVECNTGVGAWRICRNPICYRCDIIDKAEMELVTPKEKGPTVMFIGMLKA